jgi:hypothetical protein
VECYPGSGVFGCICEGFEAVLLGNVFDPYHVLTFRFLVSISKTTLSPLEICRSNFIAIPTTWCSERHFSSGDKERKIFWME